MPAAFLCLKMVEEGEEREKMRSKRKMGGLLLVAMSILCFSSMTVFAADTSKEYVPAMY